MKKIITFLVALFVCTIHAYAAIETGSCGPNCTWTLDTKDSILRVEGTGMINTVGWDSFKSYIKFAYFDEGILNIPGFAFKNAQNLVRVNIPSTVTSSGNGAFNNCVKLDSILISDIAAWCNISFSYDKYYEGATSHPLSYGKHLYLNGQKVVDLVIPDGVQSIRQYAFLNCKDLRSVVIPEGDTIINISAFVGCTNLESVSIPSSVKEVGYGAFTKCTSLTGVHITDIAAWTKIYFGFYSYTADSISNPLYYAKHLYLNGEMVTDLVIPDEVSYISQYAFQGCTDLISVEIPEGISNIGTKAFSKCSNIARLIVKSTTPPNNARYSGIPNYKCKLYVPEESVNTYANTVWWEDFRRIKAIGSELSVRFVDWDGTILYTTEVEEGESATPPANPSREGYMFIGWDKDYNNVTEDMSITALYRINRYKVEFVDWDNTILKSDSVEWNTAAIAPSNPSRKGYTFKGWDMDFEHVKTDLVVKALYEKGEDTNILIRFDNYDGGEILRQPIILKVPDAPEIEGFTFLGWKPLSEFIENEIIIQAIYKSASTEFTPDVYTNSSLPSQKLIREGNVYILRGDKIYTLHGQEIR